MDQIDILKGNEVGITTLHSVSHDCGTNLPVPLGMQYCLWFITFLDRLISSGVSIHSFLTIKPSLHRSGKQLPAAKNVSSKDKF